MKRDGSLLTAAAVTSGQLRSWCSLRAISTSTRELAFVTLLARSVRIRCGESVARSRLVLSGFGPRLRFQIELDFGGRCEAEGLGNFLEVKIVNLEALLEGVCGVGVEVRPVRIAGGTVEMVVVLDDPASTIPAIRFSKVADL